MGFVLLVKRGCNQISVNVPTESCLKSSDVLTVLKGPTKCGLVFRFLEYSYPLWLGLCYIVVRVCVCVFLRTEQLSSLCPNSFSCTHIFLMVSLR